jgi:hypothetical protein
MNTLYALLSAATFARAADLVSTHYALENGGKERNRFVRWTLAKVGFGGTAVFQLAVLHLAAWAVCRLLGPEYASIFYALAAAQGFGLCAWNVYSTKRRLARRS